MELFITLLMVKQVPSRGTKAHPIYNPATGEQIRQVIMSTPDDVNEAIEVAHKAFADWSATSPLTSCPDYV